MALIKCPECKKKISNHCDVCPQCGYPIKSTSTVIDMPSVDAIEDDSKSENTTIVSSKSPKKKVIVLIACLLLVLLASISIVLVFNMRTNVVDEIRQSVVKINVYNEDGDLIQTGSGFVVFDNNTLLTNAHVITDGYSVDAITESDERLFIDGAVYYSQDDDIAILKINGKTSIKALDYSEKYKVGDKVIAVGSPLGIKNSVSEGVVSNSLEDGTIQHSAPISSGSSGGTLFNSKGQVIGMNTATLTSGQNLNLAIPFSKIKDAYEDSKDNKVKKINKIQVLNYKDVKTTLLNNAAGKNLIDIVKNKSKATNFFTHEYKDSVFVDGYYMNQIVDEGLVSNWIEINANGGWDDDVKTYHESIIPEIRIIKINNISEQEIQYILSQLEEQIYEEYINIIDNPYAEIVRLFQDENGDYYIDTDENGNRVKAKQRYSNDYISAFENPIIKYHNGYIYEIICADKKIAKQIEEEIKNLP